MMQQLSLGDLLFQLCVNFLLYCALIIVFYMFTRFYLEEETFSNAPNFSGYIRVATLAEEELDEGLISNSPYPNSAHRSQPLSVNSSPRQTSIPHEPLDILKEKEKLTPMPMSSSSSSTSSSIKAGLGSLSKMFYFGKNSSLDSESKDEIMRNLAICAVGLNVTFVIWGLAQERILTQPYDNDYFVYSYGLVFLNRLGGLILSAFLMYYFKVSWVYSPLWEYSFPSVANMLSSWCQYEALKYVR